MDSIEQVIERHKNFGLDPVEVRNNVRVHKTTP